jgi:hypothetical protein
MYLDVFKIYKIQMNACTLRRIQIICIYVFDNLTPKYIHLKIAFIHLHCSNITFFKGGATDPSL